MNKDKEPFNNGSVQNSFAQNATQTKQSETLYLVQLKTKLSTELFDNALKSQIMHSGTKHKNTQAKHWLNEISATLD